MLLSPVPACIWYGDRFHLLYNDAFATLLGTAHPRALGTPAADVWPADWPRLENRARSLLAARNGGDQEAVQASGGPPRRFARSVLFNPKSQPLGIVWMALPEPTPAEQADAVRESEARFRQLADNVPVLIWVNGLEGCDFVNREYLRFLGRQAEDVVGMAWSRFVHPDDAEAYLSAYNEAMERRAPFEATMRFRRADGEYRWIQSSGVPRLRSDGALLGYIGCSFDVTDARAQAEALREADRRKDAFLATLAHELRNPLAPLRQGLQIMQLAEHDTTAVAQARSMMKRQLQYMVRLIDDLLDVSRITLGKVDLRKEPIDLADVIRSAVETSRPHIDEAGQRLQITLPSAPLWVEADAIRLAQVFSNLLNNASKFTARGGRITITLERDAEEALVRVSDSGVGIPPDKLKEVFDLFAQGDQVAQDGLGVGLSISRQLIELHGGTIDGHSRGRGQGSEFIVRLPTVRPPVASAQLGDDPIRPGGEPPVKVLIADDNVDSAVSLAEVLRMLGHEVRTVHDGMEAVEMAALFRPDVALLDIGMPKLTGYEVAQRIREQPAGRTVTLVALTGWGQAEHRARTRSAGFDHHLVKPVELAELQAVLGPRPGEAR